MEASSLPLVIEQGLTAVLAEAVVRQRGTSAIRAKLGYLLRHQFRVRCLPRPLLPLLPLLMQLPPPVWIGVARHEVLIWLFEEQGAPSRMTAAAAHGRVMCVVRREPLDVSRADEDSFLGPLLVVVALLETPGIGRVDKIDEGISLVGPGVWVDGQVEEVKSTSKALTHDILEKHQLREAVWQVAHHDC